MVRILRLNGSLLGRHFWNIGFSLSFLSSSGRNRSLLVDKHLSRLLLLGVDCHEITLGLTLRNADSSTSFTLARLVLFPSTFAGLGRHRDLYWNV